MDVVADRLENRTEWLDGLGNTPAPATDARGDHAARPLPSQVGGGTQAAA